MHLNHVGLSVGWSVLASKVVYTGSQGFFDVFFLGDEGVDERLAPLQLPSGHRKRSSTQIRLEILDVARKSLEQLGYFRRLTNVGRRIARGTITLGDLGTRRR